MRNESHHPVPATHWVEGVYDAPQSVCGDSRRVEVPVAQARSGCRHIRHVATYAPEQVPAVWERQSEMTTVASGLREYVKLMSL